VSSKTEICNIALSHIGVDKEIANIDTEKSEEARACRRFFDITRKQFLRETHWNFASEFKPLALVTEDTDIGFAYAYRYPADCMDVRKIGYPGEYDIDCLYDPIDAIVMPKSNYKVGRDVHGKLIYTNIDSAFIYYTMDQEDTSVFSSNAIMAMSYRLASLIVSRLSGGDFFKMRQELMQLYIMELSNARRDNNLEDSSPRRHESELVRVR